MCQTIMHCDNRLKGFYSREEIEKQYEQSGKFNHYQEPLGVGFRFIAVIFEALGSYNEDTKIPSIHRLNSSAFSQVAVWHFGDVFDEF